MRTYILSLVDIQAMRRRKFRCQAENLSQAIRKAEETNPGFFSVLQTEEGRSHANFSR
jgi:hypothetical protein